MAIARIDHTNVTVVWEMEDWGLMKVGFPTRRSACTLWKSECRSSNSALLFTRYCQRFLGDQSTGHITVQISGMGLCLDKKVSNLHFGESPGCGFLAATLPVCDSCVGACVQR